LLPFWLTLSNPLSLLHMSSLWSSS